MQTYIIIDKIEQQEFNAAIRHATAMLVKHDCTEVVVASNYSEEPYFMQATKLCSMSMHDNTLQRTYNTSALERHGIVY